MNRASLTAPEREALDLVARIGGAGWRQKLRDAWADGTLARLVGDDGPVDVLQRLRNRGFDLNRYKPAARIHAHAEVRLTAADRLCGKLTGLPGYRRAAQDRTRALYAVRASAERVEEESGNNG